MGGVQKGRKRRGALELLLNSSPRGSTLTQHASVHRGPLPGLRFDSVSSAVAYFCMECFKARDHPSFRETHISVCDLDPQN